MKGEKQEKLDNIVEVDECWVGGRVVNMSKSKRKKLREEKKTYSTKTMVMGLLERGGKLKLIALGKDNHSTILQPVIKDNVDKDAVVITDSLASYEGLNKDYAGHEVVNHTEQEYVRDGVIHTNSIEGAFSLLKRSLIGIYHKCDPQHLNMYCSETMYRYNTRKMKDPARFQYLLQNCQGRLDYKTLTSKTENKGDARKLNTYNAQTKGVKRPVIQCKNGRFVAQYPTINAAAKENNLTRSAIWRAVNGLQGSTGGYEWYYA
jgi:transposase-like protein